MVRHGVFIAIYAINNVGKSTQATMLKNVLLARHYKHVEYFKFPLYDLEPTGPLINEYLRKGNPHGFTPREFQLLNVQNKLEGAVLVRDALSRGDIVIAEDYVGTGIAWGVGAGVNKELLVRLNQGLPKPDLAILLDGERRLGAREVGHKHEQDDELTNKVRQAHLELATEEGWKVVDANGSIEDVHDRVWGVVAKHLHIV